VLLRGRWEGRWEGRRVCMGLDGLVEGSRLVMRLWRGHLARIVFCLLVR